MNEVDLVIAKALEMGALELEGMSATGEFEYKINPAKMKEFSEDIWERIMGDTNDAIASLVQAGLAEPDPNGLIDGYRLTEEGSKYYTDLPDAVTAAIKELSGDL